jgi:tetratricopeptide (TPR) repeat protein
MLVNLANTEYYRGNLDEAIRLQEQAKQLLAKILGPRDFLVGRSLNNLGAMYHEVDRNDEARAVLVQARSILDEHLPPGHAEIAGCINNLASVDRVTGRPSEALAGYTEALERALGPEHPELSQTLVGRGQTYLELQRVDEALADLRRAVALVDDAEIDPERIASARYELALGLWAADQPLPARDQMQQARALVSRPAKHEDDLPARIDAWLADHASP